MRRRPTAPVGTRRLLGRCRASEPRKARSLLSIETTSALYDLDVSQVDRVELRNARRVLKRMNFDRRFVLDLGWPAWRGSVPERSQRGRLTRR